MKIYSGNFLQITSMIQLSGVIRLIYVAKLIHGISFFISFMKRHTEATKIRLSRGQRQKKTLFVEKTDATINIVSRDQAQTLQQQNER